MEGSDQWMNEAETKLSLEEITEQVARHVPVEKGISRDQVQELIVEILSARSSEVFSEVNEAKAEITSLLRELNTQATQMNEQWTAELSRRFLPKYLIKVSFVHRL